MGGVGEVLGLTWGALGTRLSLAGSPQARARHAMQFPTELTTKACRTRPRELRLICMYFFSTRFFPVSAGGRGARRRGLASSWGRGGIHATAWALGGDRHQGDRPVVPPEPPLPLSGPRTGGRQR